MGCSSVTTTSTGGTVPSKDIHHAEHPETTAWMTRESAHAEPRAMSGQIQRLALRLGQDPDELAKSIPADTIRRLKYPVIEEVDAEGRRTFKRDPGIVDDGRNASVRR